MQQRLAHHVHVLAQGINLIGKRERGGDAMGGALNSIDFFQPPILGFAFRHFSHLQFEHFQLAVVERRSRTPVSNAGVKRRCQTPERWCQVLQSNIPFESE